MARIRSTHPEQWVDEEFVTCSPLARLLALGVRNYADDNGAFELKPLKLKMQILPADNCDINELIQELEATNQIKIYEVDGAKYGLIRNFRKYQKPKRPSCKYPKPSPGKEDELSTDDGLNRFLFGRGSERVGNWWGKFESEGEGKGKGKGKGIFKPPAVEEVAEHIREKRYPVNAEEFVAFYESKGWMIGKNKMKDWKRALVTWKVKAEKDGKPSVVSFIPGGI